MIWTWKHFCNVALMLAVLAATPYVNYFSYQTYRPSPLPCYYGLRGHYDSQSYGLKGSYNSGWYGNNGPYDSSSSKKYWK